MESALNVIAGIAAGKPAQAGIGVIASTRDSLSGDFANVRSFQGSRALRVIKANEPLAKNQVYVKPDDYDFVFGSIRDRCPHAKVRGWPEGRSSTCGQNVLHFDGCCTRISGGKLKAMPYDEREPDAWTSSTCMTFWRAATISAMP